MREQLGGVFGGAGAALEREPVGGALVARVDAQHRRRIAVDDGDAHEVGGDDVAHAHDDGLDDTVEIEPGQDRLVDVGKSEQCRELAAEARRHRVERRRELAELVVGRRHPPAPRSPGRRRGACRR